MPSFKSQVINKAASILTCTDNAVNSDFMLWNVMDILWSLPYFPACEHWRFALTFEFFLLRFLWPLLFPDSSALPLQCSSVFGWCCCPTCPGSVSTPTFLTLHILPELAIICAKFLRNSYTQGILKSTSLPLISPLNVRFQFLPDGEPLHLEAVFSWIQHL